MSDDLPQLIEVQTLTSRVDQAATWLAIKPQLRELLISVTDQMIASKTWRQQLVAMTHRLLQGDTNRRDNDPVADGSTPQADLFYAIVLLGAIDHPRRLHARAGIAESITHATLTDLLLWMHDFRAKHGKWGLDQFEWLSLHWQGKLWALGRLQFATARYQGLCHIWQHQQHRDQLLILANHALPVDADDRPLPKNAPPSASNWTTTLTFDTTTIRGHLCRPDGRFDPAITQTPAHHYQLVLKPNDDVLDVHIPATGSLSPPQCHASYAQALTFFARHHPTYAWQAMTCCSWLIDPQLARYLKPTSNLIQYQQHYHPLPQPDGEHDQIWQRVFGTKPQPLDQAPRDTSLRRVVLDHALNGGTWRFTQGIMLAHEARHRFITRSPK